MLPAHSTAGIPAAEKTGCRLEDFPERYQEAVLDIKLLMRTHSAVWREALQLTEEDAKLAGQNRIPRLPARFSVDRIFEEFNAQHKPPEETDADENSMLLPIGAVQLEIQEALLELFNLLLRPLLLQRAEHLQHDEHEAAEMAKKGVPFERRAVCTCDTNDEDAIPANPEFEASAHYGVVHLFRFFSRLPHILVGAGIRPDCFELIYTVVFQLVSFILAHKERYFDPQKDFVPQSAAYVQRTERHHKPPATQQSTVAADQNA
ncbi:MRG domain-containing protein [Aphelenchoides fujianensis]|nr:MRG domain-containing protein [Aphelenchoides fujianensis]